MLKEPLLSTGRLGESFGDTGDKCVQVEPFWFLKVGVDLVQIGHPQATDTWSVRVAECSKLQQLHTISTGHSDAELWRTDQKRASLSSADRSELSAKL